MKRNDEKEFIIGLSVFILFGIIFIGALIAKPIIRENNDNMHWNNGHCECGGNWEYSQAVGHYIDTTYIYKCDECGNIHEFYNVME